MTDVSATSDMAVERFAGQLAAWAATLDETATAMLIDLLAKAGGDVYGNDRANEIASPAGREQDASSLSPLELDDFTQAVQGILAAD